MRPRPCIIAGAMSRALLRLNAITRRDRHEMIARATDAVLKGGGFVVDFHMFSNRSVCLNIEVAAGKLGRLKEALEETGLGLTDESRARLAQGSARAEQLSAEEAASEVAGTLEITFIHDEPDLRIEVPPIPG